MKEVDYKKDANAVGSVFIWFVILCSLFAFALGISENDYNEQVKAGKDFSSHSKQEEEYTGNTFGEWFDYMFKEN